MNLIKYEPWTIGDQLHGELARVFGLGLRRYDGVNGTVNDWTPAIDIKEEDERFVLRADIPGVEPKDIEITFQDGTLTLQGERNIEHREEQDGYRRVERVGGKFVRRFTLPDTIDAEGVAAQGANGVLEIVIPKQAKVQPRKITVQAA